MKDRLITAGGALLALVALAAFLTSEEPPPGLPTSQEKGPNGYWALAEWLRESGIPVASHRQRLDGPPAPGTGHLLIATLPSQRPLRMQEIGALRAWVTQGNTLLVLAALNDKPDWTLGAVPSSDSLEGLTDMRFEPLADADGKPLRRGFPGRESAVPLRPVRAHPLAAGIQALEGVTDGYSYMHGVESAPAAQPRLRLAQATRQRQQTDALWQIPQGDGQIFLSALGSLLTNRAIGRADNRQLIANLVRHRLAPGGTVLFDDFHQGLSTLYDPAAFYQDSRLHFSILFVLALWFLYIVGAWNRLAPPRERPPEPEQQDFARAAGGFLARKLEPLHAGRMLFASWFADLEGRPTDFKAPPWPKLEANPMLDPGLLAELKADHARLLAGRGVDLKQLHNRIRGARNHGR